VPAGRLTVIVGPSGAGKSSLLRLCNRLEVPDRGAVRYRGDDVAELDPLQLRRCVGMVFQRPTPFPGTVLENLGVARAAIPRADAVAVLDRVGLDETFLERPALELSGGEAQRVSLARTLATEPEVLLMDEPTSSVDADTAARIEVLAREEVGAGVAVLWVTHDRQQARRLADYVIEVRDGRIAHAGSASDAG
jgi:putative ABC transport system ATP-binding protein